MIRSAACFALLVAFAVEADGQSVSRPQTALAALGQVNVLGLAPIGRRPAYQPAARHSAAVNRPTNVGKPFSTATSGPTVSPYLNLLREDEADGAPNYHTFVRPQVQQLELARQQMTQMQQLRRQVQRASYNQPVGATAPTSTAARYGDTGRFYSGWRR